MHLLIAGLAGLLQGVAEWLPVSSKTMVSLVYVTGGGYSPNTAYVMGLLANFGSFFAALWYFRVDVWSATKGLRDPFGTGIDAARLRFLVIATVMTAVIGLPVYAGVISVFHASAGNIFMIAVGLLLLVSTVVNASRERVARKATQEAADESIPGKVPGFVTTVIVGACQGLAALPGISRSAVTVTPMLFRGLSPRDALRLSFFLDVVALLAVGVTPFLVGHAGLAAVRSVGTVPVIVMLVTAGVCSFFMIGTVLGFAARLRASAVTLLIGMITLVFGMVYATGLLASPVHG
ncbi:MAG: undecaprenyl-diphosphate phosphatase [Actinobacteria bacterium]|nr:undecaprenyl-diphosphate phosphatase [Actinomycetota bacterium]